MSITSLPLSHKRVILAEMEVAGAIASFIAIGQALVAVPSIIAILRSLPDAKTEFISLLNEVRLFGIPQSGLPKAPPHQTWEGQWR